MMTFRFKALGFGALLSSVLLLVLFVAGDTWMRSGLLVLSLAILGYGIALWRHRGPAHGALGAVLIGLALTADAASGLLLDPEPIRAATFGLAALAGGVLYFLSVLKQRRQGARGEASPDGS